MSNDITMIRSLSQLRLFNAYPITFPSYDNTPPPPPVSEPLPVPAPQPLPDPLPSPQPQPLPEQPTQPSTSPTNSPSEPEKNPKNTESKSSENSATEPERTKFEAKSVVLVDVADRINGPTSLLLALSPAAATVIDRVGCTLLYLYLLDGPFVRYPENILSTTTKLNLGPLPFGLDKIFDSWLSNKQQLKRQDLVKKGIRATIFETKGSGLVICALSLVLVIIISEVCRLLIKRNKFTKKCEFIRETFGIKFFLLKMDGIQLEMMIYSVHQLAFASTHTFHLLGSVIAALILAYYFALAGFSFRLAFQ